VAKWPCGWYCEHVIGAFEFHCTKTTDPFTDAMNYSSKDKTIKAPGEKTPRSGLFGNLSFKIFVRKKKALVLFLSLILKQSPK
jgi:hypothetical protein